MGDLLRYQWRMLVIAAAGTKSSILLYRHAIALFILLPIVLVLLIRVVRQFGEIVGPEGVLQEWIVSLAGLLAVTLLIATTFLWNWLNAPMNKLRALELEMASKDSDFQRTLASKESELEEHIATVKRLTTPRLTVGIEDEPVRTAIDPKTGKAGQFWRLRVHNPTSHPIKRCYGYIEKVLLVTENHGTIPNPQIIRPPTNHRLPWALQNGGGFEQDIGATGTLFLAKRGSTAIPLESRA